LRIFLLSLPAQVPFVRACEPVLRLGLDLPGFHHCFEPDCFCVSWNNDCFLQMQSFPAVSVVDQVDGAIFLKSALRSSDSLSLIPFCPLAQCHLQNNITKLLKQILEDHWIMLWKHFHQITDPKTFNKI
jgi:hypothetical protein